MHHAACADLGALVEVECLRTLDRLRLRRALPDVELAARRAAVYGLVQRLDIVEITRPVLGRASQPFATPLTSLDAIHLSTALLWREANERELVMATHDVALGLAARSCGLRVTKQ